MFRFASGASKARAALLAAATQLEGRLGPFAEDGGVLRFPPPPGAESLTLGQRLDKKFLGGIHALVLELALPGCGAGPSRPLRLKYSGALVKGRAYFAAAAADVADAELAAWLNADGELMTLLGAQDLESMELGACAGAVVARFTPIGGSFVYALLPPLSSLVPLPPAQADALGASVLRLARRVADFPRHGGDAAAAVFHKEACS